VARGLVCWLTRVLVLREAAAAARAWVARLRALLGSQAEVGALARLRLLVRAKTVAAPPRQHSADPAAQVRAGSGWWGGTMTPSPVTSLRFLYGQASMCVFAPACSGLVCATALVFRPGNRARTGLGDRPISGRGSSHNMD
jgi:hypothetical protein